jgi:site-specific DNA-cytosine methylase
MDGWERPDNAHAEAGWLVADDPPVSAVTAKWAKGTGGPSGDECQNLVYVKRAHAAVDKDESWDESEVAPTLNGYDNASAVRATVLAYTTKMQNTESNQSGKLYEEYAVGIDANSPPPALLAPSAVRRLTPRECERLMSWPDDWTRWRADGSEIADSARYRACGNGVVSNVAEWIGRRLIGVR